jgi:hypothetical protein
VGQLMRQELDKRCVDAGKERFDTGRFELAAELFKRMTNSLAFPQFLTSIAYDYLS